MHETCKNLSFEIFPRRSRTRRLRSCLPGPGWLRRVLLLQICVDEIQGSCGLGLTCSPQRAHAGHMLAA